MPNFKFLALSALLAASCGVSAASAATVYNDGHGKEWRQLTDTAGISWTDMAGVCPLNGTAACSGMAGGVDMTGWYFASPHQVGQLFSYFGDFPGGLDQAFVPQETSHAALFMDTAIGPTYQDNIYRLAMGWTSTPTGYGGIWIAEVMDLYSDNPNPDLWMTDNNGGPGQANFIGSWMWQPTISAVPEPATWALFILGFGAMGAMLRVARKASAPLGGAQIS